MKVIGNWHPMTCINFPPNRTLLSFLILGVQTDFFGLLCFFNIFLILEVLSCQNYYNMFNSITRAVSALTSSLFYSQCMFENCLFLVTYLHSVYKLSSAFTLHWLHCWLLNKYILKKKKSHKFIVNFQDL